MQAATLIAEFLKPHFQTDHKLNHKIGLYMKPINLVERPHPDYIAVAQLP